MTTRGERLLRTYLDRLEKKSAIQLAYLSGEFAQVQKATRATSDVKKLIKRYDGAFADFSEVAGLVIANGQIEYARVGLQSAQEMLTFSGKDFPIAELDADELQIGYTREGQTLQDKLDESKVYTHERIEKAAQEENETKKNILLTGAILTGLYATISLARTDQIVVFREAQTHQYIYSDIAKGVELVTEPDACEKCLGLAGIVYPLIWIPNTHPRCRCGLEPVF